MGLIYKITNCLNNKVYIGQTTQTLEQRWKTHLKDADYYNRTNDLSNRPLYRAFKKYGIKNFTCEIICECDDKELNTMEQHYIVQYHSYIQDPLGPGYNATAGGDGIQYLFSSLELEEIAQLYHQGQSVIEIGRQMHYDPHVISKQLHKMGFQCHSGRNGTIYQIDKNTNEIVGWFESCVEAAVKCFNNYRHNGHINDVVRGKRKTAYGYKWCRVEDYDKLYGK